MAHECHAGDTTRPAAQDPILRSQPLDQPRSLAPSSEPAELQVVKQAAVWLYDSVGYCHSGVMSADGSMQFDEALETPVGEEKMESPAGVAEDGGSQHNSTLSLPLPQNESGNGLKVGDKVVWRSHDKDVSKGEVGEVIAFCANACVKVRFMKGAWCFKPDQMSVAPELTVVAPKQTALSGGGLFKFGGGAAMACVDGATKHRAGSVVPARPGDLVCVKLSRDSNTVTFSVNGKAAGDSVNDDE